MNTSQNINQINVNAVNARTEATRTPFEQKAYDMQYRVKNRVSGPELGQEVDIRETRADRDILLSIIGLVVFVVFLILIS
jgi:uncharacterized membrane protein YdfJ with MMPL/SSD domain